MMFAYSYVRGQPSPSQQAGVCGCVECHRGIPIAERPRIEKAGLCADCIDDYFEPWNDVLDELEVLVWD